MRTGYRVTACQESAESEVNTPVLLVECVSKLRAFCFRAGNRSLAVAAQYQVSCMVHCA